MRHFTIDSCDLCHGCNKVGYVLNFDYFTALTVSMLNSTIPLFFQLPTFKLVFDVTDSMCSHMMLPLRLSQTNTQIKILKQCFLKLGFEQ